MSTERERAQRLKLPASVVSRIVKQALPENAKIGQEARSVVSRAASVFILNIASYATDHAQGKKRRMVTAEDVIQAMKGLECERLELKMTQMVEAWKQKKTEKTAEAAKRRAEKKAQTVANAARPVSQESSDMNSGIADVLPDTISIDHAEAEATEIDNVMTTEESITDQLEAEESL